MHWDKKLTELWYVVGNCTATECFLENIRQKFDNHPIDVLKNWLPFFYGLFFFSKCY